MSGNLIPRLVKMCSFSERIIPQLPIIKGCGRTLPHPLYLVQGQDQPFVLKLRDADRFMNLEVKCVLQFEKMYGARATVSRVSVPRGDVRWSPVPPLSDWASIRPSENKIVVRLYHDNVWNTVLAVYRQEESMFPDTRDIRINPTTYVYK